MGRYVYKNRGNGIIVDNIMKPLKKVASMLTGQVVKPFAKKAIEAGVSQAGNKVGKKAADKVIEKSGKLIRKKLNSRNKKTANTTKTPRTTRKRKAKTPDEVNTLINYLIARS